MVQGIFNMISRAINTQKTTLENAQKNGELNDPKQLAQLDRLETLSDAFTSTADLQATETFDGNGVRTLTYTDPNTGMPVKSTTYDPATGNRTSDIHYKNGVVSDSGTYDPATGNKLTDSHYDDNGVLTQTDTLDADGKVVKIDRFAQTGIPISTETIDYDPETGNPTAANFYDPGTGQRVAALTYDPATGNKLTSSECNPLDGSEYLTNIYDPTTGKLLEVKVLDHGKVLTDTHISNGDRFNNVSDSFDPATGNLISQTTQENGVTTKQLTVDPQTGAVTINKFDSDGNVIGTQNFASMEDYKAFQYEQQQIEKIIEKNTEKNFEAFRDA